MATKSDQHRADEIHEAREKLRAQQERESATALAQQAHGTHKQNDGHRMKTDVNLSLREERRRHSPEQQFRVASTQASRGHSGRSPGS